MIEVEKLRKNALQIWLEARYYMEQKKDGAWVYPHWLNTDEDKARTDANKLFTSCHPWEDDVLNAITEYRDKDIPEYPEISVISVRDIMTGMQLKTSERNNKSKTIIEMILRKNGYDKVRVLNYKNEGRKIVWKGKQNNEDKR